MMPTCLPAPKLVNVKVMQPKALILVLEMELRDSQIG